MKQFLIAVMVFCLAMAPICQASVGVKIDGTYAGEASEIDAKTGDATFDGSKLIVYGWSGTGDYRHLDLGIRGWQNVAYYEDDIAAMSGASPYYVKVTGGADYICFAGNTELGVTQTGSPIEYTFRVPDDYTTNPTFVIMAANSSIDGINGAATPNYIDWDIVVNRSGTAVSSTRYDQTPVTLTSDTNMQAVTLTYATAADILAGDLITLRIWRVYEAAQSTTGRDATSDLRVYDATFRYTVQY